MNAVTWKDTGPDAPYASARVRITLKPGQIIHIDGAQLHAMGLLCGADASSLAATARRADRGWHGREGLAVASAFAAYGLRLCNALPSSGGRFCGVENQRMLEEGNPISSLPPKSNCWDTARRTVHNSGEREEEQGK